EATRRVAQLSRPGGPLELVERPIPDPGPGSVRIKVQACGVCHSDVFTKEGQWPGITFPRVPGHEVVGVIDAVGKDVPGRWQAGPRVGVGWHAWHYLACDTCPRRAMTVSNVVLQGRFRRSLRSKCSLKERS